MRKIYRKEDPREQILKVGSMDESDMVPWADYCRNQESRAVRNWVETAGDPEFWELVPENKTFCGSQSDKLYNRIREYWSTLKQQSNPPVRIPGSKVGLVSGQFVKNK